MNEELEVIPSISSSWKISEDGLVYTFFLRKDVYFHDHKFFENGKGRRVVASDFVYSFDRLLSSKLFLLVRGCLIMFLLTIQLMILL